MILQTIAELKTTMPQPTNYAHVLGYYNPGDGGGGEFYWDAAEVTPDNGGTIFEVTGSTSGRWKRIFSECIKAKWFGAKGDGIVDDTANIQKAVEVASQHKIPLNFDEQTYCVNGQIDLFNNTTLLNGTLLNSKQIPNASFFNGKDISDIIIVNITCKGVIVIGNSSVGPVPAGVRLSNCSNIKISEGRFEKKFVGISLAECNNIFIDNIKINKNITSGISGHVNYFNIRNCAFDSNGHIAGGQTHDLYLINSSNVFIENNTFTNHVDGDSYNIAVRYDSKETENYVDVKYININNNFIIGKGITIRTLAEHGVDRKPPSNINIVGNRIPDGVIQIYSCCFVNTSRNYMDKLLIQSGSTWPNFKMSFTSTNDIINTIWTASLEVHKEIDFKNVRVINPLILTDGIVINKDLTLGGHPCITVINPVLLNDPTDLMDTATYNRYKSGYVVLILNQNERAGSSGARPSYPQLGNEYFDTTLNKPVYWNGTNWIDSSGNTV